MPFDMTGQDAKSLELPGRSHFLRVGDDIFHTYSVFARGLESIGGSYYLLDETALGRQEEWEEPKGRADSARARPQTSRPDVRPLSSGSQPSVKRSVASCPSQNEDEETRP